MQVEYAEANPGLRSRTQVDRGSWPELKQSEETVHLIDVDSQLCESLTDSLNTQQIQVVRFTSAAEYFACRKPDQPTCIIIDMKPPGTDGANIQHQIGAGSTSPVIYISGHADVKSTVRAMKAGAVEFLTKPVDSAALGHAVRLALAKDRRLREKRAELAQLNRRLSLLTPRERDVFPLTVGGLLNKQAASILGISEVTLQIHRSQVMRKMEAESLADLVRMALKLRIPYWRGECRRSASAV